MVNILLINSNLQYAIQIMNYINRTNQYIKVCSIAENWKMALNILNSRRDINIVLLDLACTEYELSQLLKINEKHKKSTVFLTGDENNINKLHKDISIYFILYEQNNINKIIHKINELISPKNNNNLEYELKNKIINEVLELKYDISNLGTKYLINAIEYILMNIPNKEFNNLQTEVYPYVAELNNTSIHNVKNNIIRATNRMYYQCEVEKMKNYFHYYDDIKPDTRTVIRTIISKIS